MRDLVETATGERPLGAGYLWLVRSRRSAAWSGSLAAVAIVSYADDRSAREFSRQANPKQTSPGGNVAPVVKKGAITGGASRVPSTLSRLTGFLLHQTSEEVNSLVEHALAPFSLKGPQYGFLALLETDEAISQQDASRRLHVDRTTMVAMVDDLEHRGCIERRRNPDDRRKHALHILPHGHKLLVRAHDAVTHAENQYFATLSTSEHEMLHDLLQRLDDSAEGDTDIGSEDL